MSDKLTSKFFESDWFYEDAKYKKMAKIFMTFGKKTMKILVFGVFEVNIGTFLRICNSAYSLYAVFKQVS